MGYFRPVLQQNYVLEPMEVGSALAKSSVGDDVGHKTRRMKDVVEEHRREAPITFSQGNLNLANPLTDDLAFSNSDGCGLVPYIL
jgi:hypothetical protein